MWDCYQLAQEFNQDTLVAYVFSVFTSTFLAFFPVFLAGTSLHAFFFSAFLNDFSSSIFLALYKHFLDRKVLSGRSGL